MWCGVARLLPSLQKVGISLSAAAVVGASSALAAILFDSPAGDTDALVRDAFIEAYADGEDGRLRFGDLLEGNWKRAYIFAPLTPRSYASASGGRSVKQELPRVVPPDRSLIVFAEASETRVAVVSQKDVHLACLRPPPPTRDSAARAFSPEDVVYVVSLSLDDRLVLVATTDGLAKTRMCLSTALGTSSHGP